MDHFIENFTNMFCVPLFYASVPVPAGDAKHVRALIMNSLNLVFFS